MPPIDQFAAPGVRIAVLAPAKQVEVGEAEGKSLEDREERRIDGRNVLEK